MKRVILSALAAALWIGATSQAQTKDEKAAPKKLSPLIQKLLSGTPEEFIRRFDKDNDGKLSKDELPPALAKGFENADRNGDGKLDRDEVAAWLGVLRKGAAANPAPLAGKSVDAIIENLLRRMDKNGDGKIARDEAQGQVAANFDRLDRNQDGFLDRQELRVVAERLFAYQGAAAAPDFDALDKDADGQLSRAELQGTPWAARFAEIDADANGVISRREFDQFIRKSVRKR